MNNKFKETEESFLNHKSNKSYLEIFKNEVKAVGAVDYSI